MQRRVRAGVWLLVPLLCGLCGLTACSALPRLSAVPPTLYNKVQVPLALGAEGPIRFRVGDSGHEAALADEFVQSWQREREHLTAQGHTGPLPPTAFLVISGGGDKGAFAAGILNGWTASGTRPPFKLVTGISTGALIAPFAFLGPGYDSKLKEFYTNTSSEDILRAHNLLRGLTGDAMADTGPLRELLARQIDRAFLDQVAAEYRKGRELWIATTDLDHLHRYIWNMTKIAASPDPGAVDLFISIMLASAAIPGEFPPVLIDVEVDGQRFEEMHVDGGAMAQVFVYPIGLDFGAVAARHGASRERSLYVIRNARVDNEWAQIERKTFRIAARAISSLIQTQGMGDLYRIYLEAERDGLDFNLAYIPSSFKTPRPRPFDTGYMRALYQTGYDMAVQGYPWEKAPPHYHGAPHLRAKPSQTLP